MKIKKIISYLVVAILIVILASTMFSKFILKTELIKVFDYAFLVVLTGSMEPNIHTGELIIIREQNNYEVGDVITYKDKENNYITHRIIYKIDDNFVTKGDNNNMKDDAINIKQIEGKLLFHSKEVGFFVLYLLKPLTVIYIVALLIYENYFNKAKKDQLLEETNNKKKVAKKKETKKKSTKKESKGKSTKKVKETKKSGVKDENKK